MDVQLKETERIDDLQLKGLKLIQDTNGFCFGIDAVLLANFAKVKKGAKVVDLGTGTGIVPTLIAGKSQASKIIGVEIQEEVYEMATRSVKLNDLQLKGLKLIQDTNGFCFGIDAVLLANFAKVKKGAKVVDLGTGTGIVPTLIAGKSQASKIIGVEIQEEVYEMATRSVKLNNLEDRVEIVNADIKEIDKVLEVNGYHVVTSNPPYMHMDGIKNPNDKKAISRHEVKCNLDDVIRAASRLTMPRGKFFMIHRPIRLVDIMTLGRKYNMEPKQIQFIHPRAGKAPNLVLVEFMKDGRPELKILDPLYVYGEDGNYTEELKAIYSNEDIGEK